MKGNGYVFQHLAVRGFRRLRAVDVDLRPLTVLIGANGVGKTSFLDLWDMLAESASGRLQSYVSAHGGLAEILTRNETGRPSNNLATLQVRLRMARPELAPMDYLLELAPVLNTYDVVGEELVLPDLKLIISEDHHVQYFDENARTLVEPSWEHHFVETALAQTPKMFAVPESFRKRLASLTYYGPLSVDPQAPVCLPQPVRPAGLPGRNGEDLVACLYTMRETERERFEMVEDALQAAFPDFDRLDFPPVAAGTLSMTWKDKRFSRPLYMSQLSEGTLRYLWLTALLSSGALPAVTLIDEPEVSLHPELLAQLAELMREASRRTQLVVATHADRLVRFLQPKEVLVCNLEEGEAELKWADSLDLEHWLKEYTLDEVWRLGQLGGRAG